MNDPNRETARVACDEINTRLRTEGIPAVVDYTVTIDVFARVLAETALAARQSALAEVRGLRGVAQRAEEYLGDKCDWGILNLLPEYPLWLALRQALAAPAPAATPEKPPGEWSDITEVLRAIGREIGGSNAATLFVVAGQIEDVPPSCSERVRDGYVDELRAAIDSRDAALADVARLTEESEKQKADDALYYHLMCDENRRLEGVNARLVEAWPENSGDRPVVCFVRPQGFYLECLNGTTYKPALGFFPSKLAAVHAVAGITAEPTVKNDLTVGISSPTQAERERDALLQAVCRDGTAWRSLTRIVMADLLSTAQPWYDHGNKEWWVRRAMGWDVEAKGDANV